jgi:hypothetical protein
VRREGRERREKGREMEVDREESKGERREGEREMKVD